MYTESQREKAIKLYIKYGLKAALVIRKLGYLDRHSLKNWYNSFMINNKKLLLLTPESLNIPNCKEKKLLISI